MSDLYEEEAERHYYENKLIDANGDAILFAVHMENVLGSTHGQTHWVSRCRFGEIESVAAQLKLEEQNELDFYKFIESWARSCVYTIRQREEETKNEG